MMLLSMQEFAHLGGATARYMEAQPKLYLRMMSFAVMGTAVPPPPHELHAIIPRPLQVAHPTSESDHLLQIHGTTPATGTLL